MYSNFDSVLYFLKCHNEFQLLRNVIAVLCRSKVSATIVAAVRNAMWGISSPSLLRSPVSHVKKDPMQGKCVKDFRNSHIWSSEFPDINCGFTIFVCGTNVCGFRGESLPHECIYNHLFNIYFNYPNYPIKEIRPPKTRNIFATHKQWPPWIKMNPHYTRSLYLELNEIVTSSSITQIKDMLFQI